MEKSKKIENIKQVQSIGRKGGAARVGGALIPMYHEAPAPPDSERGGGGVRKPRNIAGKTDKKKRQEGRSDGKGFFTTCKKQ